MRRRLRAFAFVGAAVVCALLALLVIGRQNAGVADQYGGLRDVVVASADVEAGEVVGSDNLGDWLEVRRVPAGFIAPGTLSSPFEAVGLETAVALPAGGYVTAAMLRVPDDEESDGRPGGVKGEELAPGLRAVEIGVHAGSRLVAAAPDRVDVFVTGSGGGSGSGGDGMRTQLLVAGARLLELSPAGVGGGGGGGDGDEMGPLGAGGFGATAVATMAVGEKVAMRLIDAEVAGYRVTLLEVGEPGVGEMAGAPR